MIAVSKGSNHDTTGRGRRVAVELGGEGTQLEVQWSALMGSVSASHLSSLANVFTCIENTPPPQSFAMVSKSHVSGQEGVITCTRTLCARSSGLCQFVASVKFCNRLYIR